MEEPPRKWPPSGGSGNLGRGTRGRGLHQRSLRKSHTSLAQAHPELVSRNWLKLQPPPWWWLFLSLEFNRKRNVRAVFCSSHTAILVIFWIKEILPLVCYILFLSAFQPPGCDVCFTDVLLWCAWCISYWLPRQRQHLL